MKRSDFAPKQNKGLTVENLDNFESMSARKTGVSFAVEETVIPA